MIIKYINRRICELLLVLLSCYFVFSKDMNSCYDKAIMAEGHGYYAYLLSSYIYHDPTFEFFNSLYDKYYCHSFDPPTRNFINAFEGIRVNKYYPGVSLLWLPFFLLAHVIALIAGLPADGYSDVYQYAIGFAAIVYTYFGLRYTKKLLTSFSVADEIQTIVLISLLFGTNLLIYSGAWSAQTHAYSFFLIAGFLYHIRRAYFESENKPVFHLSAALVFYIAAITVRPQSVCVALLLPFFGFSWRNTIQWIKSGWRSKYFISALVIATIMIVRVTYYWHLQTGFWLLNPYHGERYDLLNPHLFDFLLSYRKGWLLYTPFAIAGLSGLFVFTSKKERLTLLLFWLLLIYVSSSWWCWTYSQTSFGQRTMVDFYALIALQAGIFFSWLQKRNIRYMHYLFAVIVIPLNILQTYQYRHGILDGDLCSEATYWKYFLQIKPVAYYPVPASSITDKKEVNNNFEGEMTIARTANQKYSGKMATYVCGNHPYSEGIKEPLPEFITGDGYTHLRVTAMAKAEVPHPEETFLVAEIVRDGKSLSYSNFSLKDFLYDDQWKEVQFGTVVPESAKAGDIVNIYYWKANGQSVDTLWIDDLRLEVIHTDHSYDLEKR